MTLIKQYGWVSLGLILLFSQLSMATGLQILGAPSNEEPIQSDNALSYVPGEILVKYLPSTTTAAKTNLQNTHGLSTKKKIAGIATTLFKLPAEIDVETAINELKEDPRVDYVEPNYYVHASARPKDKYFPLQWGLHNIGQTANGVAGAPGADINAPEAWNLSIGNGNIIIAVIDSGLDVYHPDIRPNLWINTPEMAGYTSLRAWRGNGVDDDGNGYVDDVVGWDFVYNDVNPNDNKGHGSHVAGIAAAKGNNNIGVTGVSWTAKIMALRTLDAEGNGNMADTSDALLYAERKGAHVINLSLGGYDFSRTLRDAVNVVKRAVIVCAAGNDSTNNDTRPHYPASLPNANLIAVAATDQFDRLASFSNIGRSSVDVAAPGVNILSTYSRSVNAAGYKYLGGTSMASPMVAGLAALIRATNGSLSSTQVVSIIKGSVDPKPTLTGRIATGGRINAVRALNAAGVGGDSDDDDSSGCFIRTIDRVH